MRQNLLKHKEDFGPLFVFEALKSQVQWLNTALCFDSKRSKNINNFSLQFEYE